MKILVTGATGLLGSHLLHRLAIDADTGDLEIIGLKRPNSDLNKVREVFSFYSDKQEDLFDLIQWREGDILDRDSLVGALDGIDLVYHCAAIVSFDPRDRERLIQNNIDGTRNLLYALGWGFGSPVDGVTMHRDPTAALIHISSTSALGDAPGNDPHFFVDETTPRDPNRRHSGYSVSKYESEKLVWQAMEQGLNATIFNPGIILGPGFWNKGSSKLFTQMQNGLKFYTKGGTGYIDIRDLVEILVQQIPSPQSPFPNPHSRFCLVGQNYYYKNFFKRVADQLGVPRPSIKAGKFLSGLAWRIDSLRARIKNSYALITRETAESANRISFYNNQKAKDAFNFEFRSMEETIEWICGILKKS